MRHILPQCERLSVQFGCDTVGMQVAPAAVTRWLLFLSTAGLMILARTGFVARRFARMSSLTPFSPLGTPKPAVVHQYLDTKRVKERTIVVGDVHGCFDELKELLVKCSYNKHNCTLIFVGDLVNKGPYSVETIRFARKEGAYCVRGNHDDSMLAHALKFKNSCSYELPKWYEYIKDLTDEDLEWVNELPYTISIPSLNAVVVHAGLVPGIHLEEQKPGDMCYMRNLLSSDNGFVASAKGSEGSSWASMWSTHDKSNVTVFFGHDAKRELQMFDRAVGLDTGCCYGKKLTAYVLPDNQLVSVPAKKVYEEIKSK